MESQKIPESRDDVRLVIISSSSNQFQISLVPARIQVHISLNYGQLSALQSFSYDEILKLSKSDLFGLADNPAFQTSMADFEALPQIIKPAKLELVE